MNKLIFLFLSLLSFALHALMGDHKAFVDVKAQTVVIDEPRGLSTTTKRVKALNKMCITFKAHKLLVDKIGNSLGIRLNRTRLIRLRNL
jgi:hypothetical protein